MKQIIYTKGKSHKVTYTLNQDTGKYIQKVEYNGRGSHGTDKMIHIFPEEENLQGVNIGIKNLAKNGYKLNYIGIETIRGDNN